MHHFVLIVEILGEPTCRYIFYLSFEYFRDGVAHLLENVQEEHELVFSLLTIRHVFVELIDCRLELFVLLKDFPALIRLPFQFGAITIKDEVKLGPFSSRSHLLFEHQSGSLIMPQNLLL